MEGVAGREGQDDKPGTRLPSSASTRRVHPLKRAGHLATDATFLIAPSWPRPRGAVSVPTRLSLLVRIVPVHGNASNRNTS